MQVIVLQKVQLILQSCWRRTINGFGYEESQFVGVMADSGDSYGSAVIVVHMGHLIGEHLQLIGV